MVVQLERIENIQGSQPVLEVCGLRLGERPIGELLSAATCRIMDLKNVLENPTNSRDISEANKRRELLNRTRISALNAIRLSEELKPAEKLIRVKILKNT